MQLKQWLRDKPFAVLSLMIPFLVVGYYAVTHGLASYYAVPPQYDMLYMTNYADGAANGITYEIKDNKLRFFYRGDNYGYGWPRLFRFNPQSGRYWEIDIRVPDYLHERTQRGRAFDEQDVNRLSPVPVRDTDMLKVVGSLRAPDGYEFERLIENREDFYSTFSNDRTPLLGYVSKAGQHFPLGAPPGPRTKDNVTFIGWVI